MLRHFLGLLPAHQCSLLWGPSTRLAPLCAAQEAVTAVVKRALMSPSYMLPAWQAELDNLRKDGMREDDMLLTAHQPGSPELPWFGGSHVLPIMPGAAAK